MEENKTNNKLSYEQLERMCQQLSEQARSLYTQLQEANLSNLYTRLNFLFKVLENTISFDADFVQACTKEIVELMSVNENNEENTDKESK